MKKINILILVILLLFQTLCIAGENVLVKTFSPDENNIYIGFQEKRSSNWEGRHYEIYPSSGTVSFIKGTTRASWIDWTINYASITYSDASQM